MKIDVVRTASNGSTSTLPPDQTEPSFDNTTYKLRLETDLTPSNLLYASVSTGFLPGDLSFASTSPPVVTVKPALFETETLTSYEIGSKNRFLSNTLQINGDVFYYDYGGFQLGGVQIAQDTYATVTSPARVTGAELEWNSNPAPVIVLV
jgi:iron complex outermembrane receptor protein